MVSISAAAAAAAAGLHDWLLLSMVSVTNGRSGMALGDEEAGGQAVCP